VVALDKAIIPLSLLFIAFLFSAVQRASVEDAERRQWLAESYREFGKAYNAYRKSTVDLELAFELEDPAKKAARVREAISDLDETFNYIGSTLMPFDIVERLLEPVSEGRIENAWHNCFIIPYFGDRENVDPQKANWALMLNAAKRCRPQSCPEDVKDEVLSLSAKVYSGHCIGDLKNQTIPLADFFDYTKEVVTRTKGFDYDRPVPYEKP
jgi:hypothetical protein